MHKTNPYRQFPIHFSIKTLLWVLAQAPPLRDGVRGRRRGRRPAHGRSRILIRSPQANTSILHSSVFSLQYSFHCGRENRSCFRSADHWSAKPGLYRRPCHSERSEESPCPTLRRGRDPSLTLRMTAGGARRPLPTAPPLPCAGGHVLNASPSPRRRGRRRGAGAAPRCAFADRARCRSPRSSGAPPCAQRAWWRS